MHSSKKLLAHRPGKMASASRAKEPAWGSLAGRPPLPHACQGGGTPGGSRKQGPGGPSAAGAGGAPQRRGGVPVVRPGREGFTCSQGHGQCGRAPQGGRGSLHTVYLIRAWDRARERAEVQAGAEKCPVSREEAGGTPKLWGAWSDSHSPTLAP